MSGVSQSRQDLLTRRRYCDSISSTEAPAASSPGRVATSTRVPVMPPTFQTYHTFSALSFSTTMGSPCAQASHPRVAADVSPQPLRAEDRHLLRGCPHAASLPQAAHCMAQSVRGAQGTTTLFSGM